MWDQSEPNGRSRPSTILALFLPSLTLASIFSVCLPAWLYAAQPTVGELIKSLNNSRQNRLIVMRRLGEMGAAAKEAVPILASYLGLEDQGQADQAARALAQIGPPSVAELVKALTHSKPEVQRRTLRALGVIGPEAKAAVRPVSQLLNNRDVKLRTLAAEVLAEMGPAARPAVRSLGAALHDSDSSVRLMVALALHEIGEDTVTELLPLAKERRLSVRLGAVQSLPIFHESNDALEALVGALHDPELKLRATAAVALVRLGPAGKAALPALLSCLKENNRELQSEAFAAILSIASWRDPRVLQKLSAVNDGCRWASIGGSRRASSRREQRLKSFRTALEDANPTRRLGAVLAIGQMGPAANSAVPRLAKMSEDSNQVLQAAVLFALHAIDGRKHKDTAKGMKLLSEITSTLSGAGNPETEDLIQLYILASTILSAEFRARLGDPEMASVARKAREWSAEALDKLPYSLWSLPAFVRGVNAVSRFGLGFTEPFSRLTLKFDGFVLESKDLKELAYAFTHLSEGIDRESPYWPAIERNLYQVVTNPTFLDAVVLAKQQRMRLILAGASQQARMLEVTRENALPPALAVAALGRADGNQLGMLFTKFFPLCHGHDREILGLRGAITNQLGWLGQGPGSVNQTYLSQTKELERQVFKSLVREQAELLEFLRAVLLLKSQETYRTLRNEDYPKLLLSLSDPSPLVRWVAVYVINEKRKHAEKELLPLLRDTSVDVRMIARQTLVRLSRGTDFGPGPLDTPAKVDRAIERWQNWLVLQDPTGTSRRLSSGARSPGESLQSLPRQRKE